MGKKDGGKKAAANKARKRNVTAKKLQEKFIVSFMMDSPDHELNGQEIQAQKPYKDKETYLEDKNILAEKYGVHPDRIRELVSDNRNDTEKKKDGEKPKKKKKAKLSDDEPLLLPKDTPEYTGPDPYRALTPEQELAEIKDFVQELENVKLRESLMKSRHSSEKAAMTKDLEEAMDKLFKASAERHQLDAFRDQKPDQPAADTPAGDKQPEPDPEAKGGNPEAPEPPQEPAQDGTAGQPDPEATDQSPEPAGEPAPAQDSVLSAWMEYKGVEVKEKDDYADMRYLRAARRRIAKNRKLKVSQIQVFNESGEITDQVNSK